MAEQVQRPEIAVGVKVAVYTSGWSSSAWVHEITRLTAKQVVLDNGWRFRLDDLTQIGDRNAELRRLDDPTVCHQRAIQALGHLRGEVDRIVGRGTFRTSADIDTALRDIEQQIAEVRRRLVGQP